MGFFPGKSWKTEPNPEKTSLCSPVLDPQRDASLAQEGVLPSDLTRAKEQNGLWPVTQNGPLAVDHGIMSKFTINVLPKENIRAIDYLLITILLYILYL